jgi:sugar phosphate isomerase/epimerase
MEKLSGRVDILHLKDLKVFHNAAGSIEGTMTEIGNGNLWWDGIMATAEKIGVKSYVVEQDRNFIDEDPFKSLKVSSEYLKKYMA